MANRVKELERLEFVDYIKLKLFLKQMQYLRALLALPHPTTGAMPKGRGVGASSDTHCMKRPSLQPSATIQSEVEVAPTIRITVITQHVKAIT